MLAHFGVQVNRIAMLERETYLTRLYWIDLEVEFKLQFMFSVVRGGGGGGRSR